MIEQEAAATLVLSSRKAKKDSSRNVATEFICICVATERIKGLLNSAVIVYLHVIKLKHFAVQYETDVFKFT